MKSDTDSVYLKAAISETITIVKNPLEVQSQISGNDADVKQVLYSLKLPLLEIHKNVQALKGE